LPAQIGLPKNPANKEEREGFAMPTDPGWWTAQVPRLARRDVLKRIAAAGAAAGAPAFPVLAEENAKVAPASATLAETLARYATTLKYEDLPEDVVRLAKRAIRTDIRQYRA
jgi:hypothetical protein